MEKFNMYEEIAQRTGGNIYIGVVGPVRTGKSTFVKRFMDLMVVPNVENYYAKSRLIDQMPQSGDGRAVYTTEPKFIPEEGIAVKTSQNMSFNVKMIDCVGYMVEGATAGENQGTERLVKTPWDQELIPFSKAAQMGTDKVIREHSTVAIVLTTDGTIGEIPGANYKEAEEQTICQLMELGKPFMVVVNSKEPTGPSAIRTVERIRGRFNVPALALNCMRMNEDDIDKILTLLLSRFPATEISFHMPGYIDALDPGHWIKNSIIKSIKSWMESLDTIGSLKETIKELEENQLITSIDVKKLDMADGKVCVEICMDEGLYYQVIEEIMGQPVKNDSELFLMLKEYSKAKQSYDIIKDAMDQVEAEGYGIVQPRLEAMTLDEPEVFKQGNKYGVRLRATAPCLHIIKTDISTEVSPVVGSQSQSEDLVKYLNNQFDQDKEAIWETNLFGKSVQSMVTEQMDSKVNNVPETIRVKVQKSLQKISDEGKDYFICIII